MPYQAGKPAQTPTLRWIYQLFEGMDPLIVNQQGAIVSRQVLNLRLVHRTLGPPVDNYYLLAV